MGVSWPPGMDLAPAPPYFPQAACRGQDPNLWFPERQDGQRLSARDVCATCPHIGPCAAFGIAHPRMPGVWGGLSGRQRRIAAREHRQQPQTCEPRQPMAIEHPDLGEPTIEDLHALEAEDGAAEGDMPRDGFSEARSCAGCSKPLTGSQTRWCSTSCKRRAESRTRRNPIPRTPPYSENTKNVLPEHGSPATAANGLPGALNGYVVGYLLDVAGEQWTLTRSTTNGGSP